MKYCNKCLEPDTRPNSKFNKDGLCYSCEFFKINKNNDKEKHKLDILKNIFKKYPKEENSHFDCIIGVSGGKDSTRQALWLRDKLKIKPLLVCCTYPPEQITERGANNLSNLINLGFDLIVSGPSPGTWKKIMKKGFLDGNYLTGPELALYSSLPQIAIKHKIKLIFWGASPAEDSNEKNTAKDGKEWDGNSLRNTNTLKNGNVNWIKKITKDDGKIIPYVFPSPLEFKKNNIQIIYLGWFWNNWSITYNSKFSSLHGLEIRKDHVSNTGDLYGAMALDEDWVIVNQMMKYFKFGFGRVTDYLCPEIRFNRISREDAIRIIEKYDGACHEKYINSFCKYINISKTKFWSTVEKYTNKKLFKKNSKKNGKKFIRKFKVGLGL
jgi:N-acetyl sugar amidotransferase